MGIIVLRAFHVVWCYVGYVYALNVPCAGLEIFQVRPAVLVLDWRWCVLLPFPHATPCWCHARDTLYAQTLSAASKTGMDHATRNTECGQAKPFRVTHKNEAPARRPARVT